jgi:hypothetical protein
MGCPKTCATQKILFSSTGLSTNKGRTFPEHCTNTLLAHFLGILLFVNKMLTRLGIATTSDSPLRSNRLPVFSQEADSEQVRNRGWWDAVLVLHVVRFSKSLLLRAIWKITPRCFLGYIHGKKPRAKAVQCSFLFGLKFNACKYSLCFTKRGLLRIGYIPKKQQQRQKILG